MTVNIFITDDEIKAFFEKQGYHCQLVEVPRYVHRGHGRGDVETVEQLHVVADEMLFEADQLMSEYLRVGILEPDFETKRKIEQAAFNIARRQVVFQAKHSNSK